MRASVIDRFRLASRALPTAEHSPRRARPACSQAPRARRARHGLCFAPHVRRVARAGANHAHPSLARGCPRRQSSLARLRALSGSAPPWGCGAPRPSQRFRHAPAPPPPRALAVRKPRPAAGQLPRARSVCARFALRWANRASRPAARAICGRCGGVGSAPLASVALRAKSTAARLASLAPRRVRLRLSPSPCSRRRASPPAPFWPSHRARRRCESAAVPPLPPPFPATSAAARRWRWNGSRGSRG